MKVLLWLWRLCLAFITGKVARTGVLYTCQEYQRIKAMAGNGGHTSMHVLLCTVCAYPDNIFMQVHTEDFVSRFSSGTLSEMEMRRIGFGEVTRHADLIERTKAEVACTLPCLSELKARDLVQAPCM